MFIYVILFMLVEKLVIMYLFIYMCNKKKKKANNSVFSSLSEEAFLIRQEITQFNYDHMRNLYNTKT